MNTYALAVETETNSNLFEVFTMINTSPNNLELFNRWNNAFTNGNVTAIKSNGIDQISLNSFWNGSSLILDDSSPILEHYNKEHCIILLSNNYVFGAVHIRQDQFIRDKYAAALENKVIGIDITNVDSVELGSIWNGNEFIILGA